MNLSDLFGVFEQSAFRLESLAAYKVDEETDAFREFRNSGVIRPGFNHEWAAMVADAVAAGKTMKRLRLLSSPLSEYERFEVAAYEAGIAAGEHIRVADRSDFQPSVDFWLFDERWIAVMNYTPEGAFLGADVREVTDRDLSDLEAWRVAFETATDLRQRFPLGKR